MSNASYKTSVTGTSLDVTDMVSHGDPQTGEIRYEGGKKYILVLSGASIADGYACSIDTSLTAATGDGDDTELVVVLTTANLHPLCWNNTGATVATATYFWGIVEGRGYAVADDANIDNGEDFAVETTAGEVMDWTDAVNSPCGFALEDGAAGTTFKAMLMGAIGATPVP